MTNKQIVTTSLVSVGAFAILTAAGIVGVTQFSAQENNSSYPPIITNLSNKFGVSEEEVKTVFEETREQRHEERLNDLVSKGVITEEQKQLIQDKKKEMQSKYVELRNSEITPEQRKEIRETHMEEMKKWAEENNIPAEAFQGPREMKGGRMGRGRHNI
jgi:hypothetical protein